jgi:hypothetical protein
MTRKGRAASRRINKNKAPAAVPTKQDGRVEIVGPTPEQGERATFVKKQHTSEMGQQVGFGYRRRPLFETMADASSAISRDELSALRFYRSAFDRCDRSPTRSCLAVGNGGRSSNSGVPTIMLDTPAIAEARRKVRFCEAALGKFIATVRAVALDDRSFSDIAIERYGSRPQNWIVINEPVLRHGKKVIVDGRPLTRPVHQERIVPRSGRHREIVRQEFAVGLKLLTDAVRSMVSTPGVEEVWIRPGAKDARIERGACAPNGLYRMWGSSSAVDAVLRDMRGEHGEHLRFPTAQAARLAFDAAAGLRLTRLDEDELKL